MGNHKRRWEDVYKPGQRDLPLQYAYMSFLYLFKFVCPICWSNLRASQSSDMLWHALAATDTYMNFLQCSIVPSYRSCLGLAQCNPASFLPRAGCCSWGRHVCNSAKTRKEVGQSISIYQLWQAWEWLQCFTGCPDLVRGTRQRMCRSQTSLPTLVWPGQSTAWQNRQRSKRTKICCYDLTPWSQHPRPVVLKRFKECYKDNYYAFSQMTFEWRAELQIKQCLRSRKF